jgi:hypothetical protein
MYAFNSKLTRAGSALGLSACSIASHRPRRR